ncbi:MAG: N-acetyltransferase [Flavobacteriaceae bacterium]|nr:N-acetyltransferase [Flavobacteriaceae bacterium]
MSDTLMINDNDFLRQFELKIDGELAKIEYSLQERKIFLTKFIVPENIQSKELETNFIKSVFENVQERKLSVVPTSPKIASFIRKNKEYKELLPVGIKI